VTSLSLLPLVILALQYALERRTRRSFALAALAIATLFLTNVPGAMATGLAVFCWIAVQPAIACSGVPPSSLATVMGNVGPMPGAGRISRWAGIDPDPAGVRGQLRDYLKLDRPSRPEALRLDRRRGASADGRSPPPQSQFFTFGQISLSGHFRPRQ
jgi:hypothetical protein